LIVSPPPTCSLPVAVILSPSILPEMDIRSAVKIPLEVMPPLKTSEVNPREPPIAILPPTYRFPVVVIDAALILPLDTMPAALKVPVEVSPPVSCSALNPNDPRTAKSPPTNTLPTVVSAAA
jgi:hypothetical protein